MTPQKALIELKLRLNKLASNDYDNIPDWVAISAINKAQVEWIRKQMHGDNQFQEGDEESKVRVDDLQALLVEQPLKGRNKELYFESDSLPSSYLWGKRILPKAKTKHCSTPILLYSTLVEEANVPVYLTDWAMQPSFDWAQTFHTMVGNRIRIYTNQDFTIDDVNLMFYRKPKQIDISTVTHEDGTQGKDTNLEFKDDICHIILDEAASIIAADTESVNAFQVAKARADINN